MYSTYNNTMLLNQFNRLHVIFLCVRIKVDHYCIKVLYETFMLCEYGNYLLVD